MDEIRLAKRRTDGPPVNPQDTIPFRSQGKLPLTIDTGISALAGGTPSRTSPLKGNIKLPTSERKDPRNHSTSSPRTPTRSRTGKSKSSTPSPRTPLSAVSLGSANPAELISRKPRSLSFYLDLDGSDAAERRQRARAYSMVADNFVRTPDLASPGDPPKSALAVVTSLLGSRTIRSAFDAVPSRSLVSPLHNLFLPSPVPSSVHPIPQSASTSKSPVSSFASTAAGVAQATAGNSPPSPTTKIQSEEHYSRMNARLLNASLHRSRHLQERRMKLKCKSDIIKNRVLLQKYKDRMQQLRFQTRHNFDMVAADLKRRLIIQRNTERWRAHVRKAQTIAKLQRLQKCLYLRRTYSDTFSEMTPAVLRGGMMQNDEIYSPTYTSDVELDQTAIERSHVRSAYPHSSQTSDKHRLYLPKIATSIEVTERGDGGTLSTPSSAHTSPSPINVQIMRSGVGRLDDALSPISSADTEEGNSSISAWGGTNVFVPSADIAVHPSSPKKIPSLTIPFSITSPSPASSHGTSPSPLLSPLRRSISVPSNLQSPVIPLVSPTLEYPGVIPEVRERDLPPITRYTLRELDLEEMLNSVQLRHDLVFDPALIFRRNFDGEVGAMKQAKNDNYWAKLEADIEGKEYQVPESVAKLPPQLAEHLPSLTTDPSSQPGQMNLSRIPGLIYEVREIMLELLPYSEAFHYELNAKMDIQLIQQEIQNGVFNIIGLVEWISEILRANCAPFRDRLALALVDDVKEGRFGKAFRGLFEMLELMKLDIANHQLGSEYRPQIIANAAEYEWKSFKMQMDSETTTLDGTSAWLKEGMQRSPGKKFDEVYAESVVHLVTSPPEAYLGEDSPESPVITSFPETFRLDTSRLQAFHHDYQDVVIMASVLMLFRQAAGPKCNAVHAQEMKKIVWVLLNDTDTTMAHVTSEIAHRAGKIQGRIFGDKEVAVLTGMAERTLSRDSKVLEVLGKKVGTVLTSLLSGAVKTDKDGVKKVLVTVTPIPGLKSVVLPVDRNQLRSFGLFELEEEILDLGARIKQLTDYNRDAYLLAYQAIWSSMHDGEKIAGVTEEGAAVGAESDVEEVESDDDSD